MAPMPISSQKLGQLYRAALTARPIAVSNFVWVAVVALLAAANAAAPLLAWDRLLVDIPLAWVQVLARPLVVDNKSGR